MIGEFSYIAGITACVISGTCGIIVIVNEHKQDDKPEPFLKWLKKNEISVLFVMLLFSTAYAYAIGLYSRHFLFMDKAFLNSMVFETRTWALTICVSALAWRMVLKVFRWFAGLEKDLKW